MKFLFNEIDLRKGHMIAPKTESRAIKSQKKKLLLRVWFFIFVLSGAIILFIYLAS